MKTATVYKDKTGYWVAKADDTGKKLGEGLYNTELEAYKAANFYGYLVR